MDNSDIVAHLEDALKGKKVATWEPGQLFDFLRKTIAELIDSLDPADLPLEVRQQIHDGVKYAFDTVVRPFDIPYVPAIAEGLLEDWVWNLICKELDDRLELDH